MRRRLVCDHCGNRDDDDVSSSDVALPPCSNDCGHTMRLDHPFLATRGVAIPGHDLGRLLWKHGVIPDNSRNVEIHVPVDGLLTIQCEIVVYPEDVPKVIAALQEWCQVGEKG